MRCGLLLKLLLCCAACCCRGNKVAVIWALGRVTAPQAHPQHAYARTAQQAPVASIDTLRMTATEHTEQTQTQRATQQQQGAASRALPLVFLFSFFYFVICHLLLYSKFLEFYMQFKTEMIVLGSRKQFQTRLCFGLVSSLWFATQPLSVLSRKHPTCCFLGWSCPF